VPAEEMKVEITYDTINWDWDSEPEVDTGVNEAIALNVVSETVNELFGTHGPKAALGAPILPKDFLNLYEVDRLKQITETQYSKVEGKAAEKGTCKVAKKRICGKTPPDMDYRTYRNTQYQKGYHTALRRLRGTVSEDKAYESARQEGKKRSAVVIKMRAEGKLPKWVKVKA